MANKRNIPPKLSRRRPITTPSFRILIICEGDNTEPDYFRKFSDEYGNKLVSLQFEEGAGVPSTIVRKAIEQKERASSSKSIKSGYEVHDEIWAVFDFDDHPNVKQAIGQAKSRGIRVAYSNPCFELWPVLHLTDSDGPISGSEMQKKLQQIMPKYDRYGPKILDYRMISGLYDEAKSKAIRGKKMRAQLGGRYDNPVTNVYKLTESIITNSRLRKRQQLSNR